MTRFLTIACVAAGVLLASGHAQAQIGDLSWHSVDAGGGVSQGDGFDLAGAIGQHDAGVLGGGGYELTGGFWAGAGVPASCYANCDGSTAAPVLNINDFVCFMQRYAAADPQANCDASTVPPTLNVNDFVCFQLRYAAGCP